VVSKVLTFFIYSRQDSEFALRIAGDLKSEGAAVWIDQLDISPGTPWDRAIEDALTKCPQALVILSPAAVSSDKVRDEISFALRKQKSIIPVLYLTCEIPLQLERRQHIDFRSDYVRAFKKLLESLGTEKLDQSESHRNATGPDALVREEATALHPAEFKRAAAAGAAQPQTLDSINSQTHPSTQPSSPQVLCDTHTGESEEDDYEGEPPPLVRWLIWSWVNIRRHSIWVVLSVAVIIAPILPTAIPKSYTWIREITLTPDGAFKLAEKYWSPENRNPDYKEAMRLFRIAADAGNARAMADVGWMYESGDGLSGPDYDGAMQWYQRAVEHGDKIANWNVGRLYEIGCGVHRDLPKAQAWYQKAADEGVYEGQRDLKRLQEGNVLQEKC